MPGKRIYKRPALIQVVQRFRPVPQMDDLVREIVFGERVENHFRVEWTIFNQEEKCHDEFLFSFWVSDAMESRI